jgi:hypothetical protein
MANEAAYKARRSEYLIQPGDVLLDGVCPLQRESGTEKGAGFVTYKRILDQCFNLSLAGESRLVQQLALSYLAETRVPV